MSKTDTNTATLDAFEQAVRESCHKLATPANHALVAKIKADLTAQRDELLALAKRALAIEMSVTAGQERELREGFVQALRTAIAKATA
jgi:hypothetical protein